MEINNIDKTQLRYKLGNKKFSVEVSPDKVDIASKIAHSSGNNENFLISDKQLKDFLREQNILKDPSTCKVDTKKILKDFKISMQGQPLPQRDAYHSYEQVIGELKGLEAKYPDIVKTVSLGKTAEGRDIMAVKISKGAGGDTGDKPGMLITGCHHAREWMAMEAPLTIAKNLAEGYGTDEKIKNRVDNAEIWVVPLVNPDGYEYSRTKDPFWRKNRDPIHKEDIPQEIAKQLKADKNGVVAYGVDPNRNYYDGNPDHMELYRPAGDTAESTWDDFGYATSDNPKQETYRGPKGASEKEVQAMLGLWLNRKNIKGIVNHHSYGNKIMYPWGVTQEHVANEKLYKEIAGKMQNASKEDGYSVEQSSGMYPASGDPDDFAHANGRLSFTIELGDSFQPDPSDMGHIARNVYNANMAFLDWMLDNKEKLNTLEKQKLPSENKSPEITL